MPENKDKKFWGVENGKYTPEYTSHVEKMVGDSAIMKKAVADLAYTKYGVNSPEDFKRLALDNNPKEVHEYVRKHYESTTPKAKSADYNGTYVDNSTNSMVKRMTLSEFNRRKKEDPTFKGYNFEAEGDPIPGSEFELSDKQSHKPQKTTSFYDLPPQTYDKKTDSFYDKIKPAKKEDEKPGDVAQNRY